MPDALQNVCILCYDVKMRNLDLALAQLRSLPPAFQVQVVDYIQQLHATTRRERLNAINETAGCLEEEQGRLLDEAIQEGCEPPDD